MWTYIENKNIEKYLKLYPKLEEFWDIYGLVKNDTITFLPRYFYIQFPSNLLINYNGKKKGKIEKINIKLRPKFKLRPKQQKAFDKVNEIYNNQKYVNGILKLPTGSGKTILAIYIAYKLKMKTAIVVNNKKLLKEWILKILEFTDLKEEDIGLINQHIVSCKNKKIVMCMSQTISSHMKTNITKMFSEIDSANIGLVFIDEVHSSSAAEQNSKVSLLFRTKNIIGLSATPFHTSYQDILMKNTIGNIIYESNEYEIVPDCYIQFFDSGLTKYRYIQHMSDFIKQRGIYNKIIVQSDTYFDTIVTAVQTFKQKNNNAQILIIAMTIKQVQLISEKLKDHGYDNEILVGKSPDVSDNCNIIIGTYKFCREGLDIVRLNCLLIAVPLSGKKSYLQTTGRILRSAENKTKATVVSLFDSCFINMFLKDIKRIENIIREEHKIILKTNYFKEI